MLSPHSVTDTDTDATSINGTDIFREKTEYERIISPRYKKVKAIYNKLKQFLVSFTVVLIFVILFVIACLLIVFNSRGKIHTPVNVIQHNIEYGAEAYSLLDLVEIYKGNDVILIQEAFTENGTDSSSQLAEMLKMNYMSFNTSSTAVISRWDITLVHEFNKGALVKINNNIPFHVLVMHLDDWYYQPFQAQYIPYERDGIFQPNTSDPGQLFSYALTARGQDVITMTNVLEKITEPGIIMGGDFNEPSFMDWTDRNVKTGFCPVSVRFPSTLIISYTNLGMQDCYRSLYPDEVLDQGLTWPDRKVDYEYRSDRIDMLFVDKFSTVNSIKVVCGTKSDHCALAATIKF